MMCCALEPDLVRTPPPGPALLSTEDLCKRWLGLPTEGTLRNWRVLDEGPDYYVLMPFGARHVVYPIAAVQAFELAHSSIPRHKPWSGVFLSVDKLLERWLGGPNEISESTLRDWRSLRRRLQIERDVQSERDRVYGPPYVMIHVRQPLYPIEGVRQFEQWREFDRLAKERASRVLEPVGLTFGEILMRGPQPDPEPD